MGETWFSQGVRWPCATRDWGGGGDRRCAAETIHGGGGSVTIACKWCKIWMRCSSHKYVGAMRHGGEGGAPLGPKML